MVEDNKKELGIININYFVDETSVESFSVRTHVKKSNSLDSLIFDWIGESRSVELVNADCDPGEEEGFLLSFKEDEKELGAVVISMNWLKSAFPLVPPATMVENYTCEFEKEWCHTIADEVLKREDTLKIIVSYLIAEYSQIIVDGKVDFLIDNCEEEILAPIKDKQLICVMPHYSDPKTGHGFGAHYWSFQ